MNLNDVIMNSIKNVITEGKEKQQTSIQFGPDKGSSVKDENVTPKNQAGVEAGLKSDGASEDHANPQGEAKSGLTPEQMSTNLVRAVTAGIGAACGGIGSKKETAATVDFHPPAPADDKK